MCIMCLCVCTCVHTYTHTMYVCIYSSVVVELEAELNTESVLRWKQDIMESIDDKSDDANTSSTVPFLLLGSKQDKVIIHT